VSSSAAVPRFHLRPISIYAGAAEVLWEGIVGNRNRSAKRKNAKTAWNVSCEPKPPVLIASHCVPVHKEGVELSEALRSFTRNLLSVGLSERTDPLTRIRRSPMHKILLAEDDNDMRRFLVKALENAGFQVSSHDNGMSAFQRLREEPFEMLLTDIVMPEMDGIELARRASELDPDIKIMFITGFAAVALNSDSEAPKNAKVLAKPVHLRELVSEVNKMLAA
jgi:two-component system cell cycle response regulator CpdR